MLLSRRLAAAAAAFSRLYRPRRPDTQQFPCILPGRPSLPAEDPRGILLGPCPGERPGDAGGGGAGPRAGGRGGGGLADGAGGALLGVEGGGGRGGRSWREAAEARRKGGIFGKRRRGSFGESFTAKTSSQRKKKIPPTMEHEVISSVFVGSASTYGTFSPPILQWLS